MATSFSYTPYSYASGNVTAPTPSGSGGILVVVGGSAGTLTPQTPAHWTPLASEATYAVSEVRGWWALASASPNMVFTRSGTGEAGLGTFRIDNADVGSPSVLAGPNANAFNTVINIPDIASAPNGVMIGVLGLTNGASLSSTSLGFTEDYDSSIGSDGWNAGTIAIFHKDVTPGGGTLDGGTATVSTSAGINALSFVVKTGGTPVVPDAPTAVVAAPGDTTVSLTWTAPVSDGGSAITDYVIQWSEDDGSPSWTTFTDTTSTTPSVTVTGLTNNTAYIFRVAAVNAIGQGSYSSNSNSVIPSGGYIVDQPTNSVRRKNASVSFVRRVRGGSSVWLTKQASEVLNFDIFDELVITGEGVSLKFWNGSAWAIKPIKVWSGSAWVSKPMTSL